MAGIRHAEFPGVFTGRMVLHSAFSPLFRCVGAPLAIGGAAGLVHAWSSEASGDGETVLIGVCTAFLAVGLIMLLHVARRVIDRDRGLLESAWGVGTLLFTRTQPLDRFERVRVDAVRVQSSDGGSQTQYRVALDAEDGALQPLWISLRYDSARRKAEQVARFLSLPMADHTSGVVSVRAADALDRSAIETWREQGVEAKWSDPPADSRIAVRRDADGVDITLPATGLTGPVALMTVAMIPAVTAPVAIFSMGALSASQALVMAPILFAPAAVLGSLMLWVAAGRELVRVDSRGVTVSRRLGPISRSARFPAGELEELVERRIARSPLMGSWSGGIALRSDARTCNFAVSLDAERRDWLASAIRSELLARECPES